MAFKTTAAVVVGQPVPDMPSINQALLSNAPSTGHSRFPGYPSDVFGFTWQGLQCQLFGAVIVRDHGMHPQAALNQVGQVKLVSPIPPPYQYICRSAYDVCQNNGAPVIFPRTILRLFIKINGFRLPFTRFYSQLPAILRQMVLYGSALMLPPINA